MALLTTTPSKALYMQEAIRNVNLAQIFDIQVEAIASNVWNITADFEIEDELIEDIMETLASEGCIEFQIEQ